MRRAHEYLLDLGTSQGKIVPIKSHWASLICGITSLSVGSRFPDKYLYETLKRNFLMDACVSYDLFLCKYKPCKVYNKVILDYDKNLYFTRCSTMF